MEIGKGLLSSLLSTFIGLAVFLLHKSPDQYIFLLVTPLCICACPPPMMVAKTASNVVRGRQNHMIGHNNTRNMPSTSQKAKLDLQKSIVTNSSTYLINCNFFSTVIQFIFFLFKLFFRSVPFDFFMQNLVVISKI